MLWKARFFPDLIFGWVLKPKLSVGTPEMILYKGIEITAPCKLYTAWQSELAGGPVDGSLNTLAIIDL